ncbi:zinc finger protein on ecdysone puffs isoform X1 [Eupeodes corollae]|uniref:zinc finger protein on ecdysone puffs isoform X1 n=2 Tax=Eupeodes corollae TaxID=290404 RepID=UPI00248F7E1B|nr:zinc finger protein on ecdysone puffs isoform X1 [Eupeodes corollae]
MSPSVNMAFRGNNNRNRNFGGNYGGGPMAGGNNRMGMNMSPWDNQNAGGGNYGGGNMRQGGGGGVGGGQGMNAQAISLANNLLNNLFRNQNPPSLLDLPRGGGGMAGNRNQRPGPMVNRAGPGNRNNQRRVQGGFNNRGGAKVAANKQGGGIRKQNAFDRAKKLLAKNSNKKKDSAPGENTENTKKNESQVKESPYANVPNDMFYCHLCKKHMWDANSFENHIKGRAHLMMREGIEESYRLRANMIRQEAKIAEQLKSVELDRLKRMGKSKNRNLEYCTMCDLNFHGHLSAHRKSDGHLQLKKFLHPKCAECNKEFSTRIDYDSHLLSADHLKKAAEKNTKVGERKKNTLTILTEEDELKDVRPPQKKKKKVAAPAVAGEVKKEGEEGAEKKDDEEGEEKKEGEEDAADETKEGDELNETKEEEEEEVALPEDAEDIIVDFNDGDDVPVEIDAKLPKYNWTRPVGASMITKLECYECSICGKFFDNEKTVEVHSRTVSHHRQFVKFLNDKSSDTKIAQKRAAAAIEETERKKRKIEEATAAAAASEVKKEEGGEAEGEAKEENGEEANDELYDPSEATGDDEDVDMAENGDKEAVADEEMADEENGDAAAEEEEDMETQNDDAKDETPTKADQPAAKAPATPAPATPATPAATTPTQASPQKKGAAAAKTPAAKATPRGRGRGRYNRY